jgi:hypothetical protein
MERRSGKRKAAQIKVEGSQHGQQVAAKRRKGTAFYAKPATAPSEQPATPTASPAAPGSAASITTFNDLPLTLQVSIFASGGAPLNTCKASAAILEAQASSELCQWLLAAKQRPLVTAVKAGLWGICRQLLKEGHKPAKEDLRFALVKAAALGRGHTVASLLDAGVCQVQQGNTLPEVHKITSLVFSIATEKNRLVVCRLLLDRKVPFPPGALNQALKSAAGNTQSIQLLQLLLEKGEGVKVGRHGYDYGTPLYEAIVRSNVQAIRLLLQHGASLNPVRHSQTPLEDAVRWRCSLQAVRLLIAHGAKDRDYAAVKKATQRSQWDIVELLMSAQA